MNPGITPELRSWIVEQASAGFQPETIVEAMTSAGWPADVALQALEQTLREMLHARSAGQSLRPVPGSPGARRQEALQPGPVPEVDLERSPREIRLADRTVQVIAALNLPRVVVLGGLLSDQECEALIEAARPRMARSLTVQTQTGGEEANPDRTSNGMFFTRGESELVSRIEARIAQLVNWPVQNGEGIQVLNYPVGAEYKAHYDYFDPAEPGTPTILKRGGQRVGTVVMYLNEPELGGGTSFPDIGLEVAPQRGHAVFFSYNLPSPATRTLHGGAPVLKGEKWVATKWLREREFQ